MASSLLALLDDIATILDDVSVLAKVAAKKTAGVLGDDLALNAQQVSGVKADRELPVVWAVAKVPSTPGMPSAMCSIAWPSAGTPCTRMPPPTRNIAAVPAIDSPFMSHGAAARMPRPKAREPAPSRWLR